MNIEGRVKKTFDDLFPFNRSLTGKGVEETFNYLSGVDFHASQLRVIYDLFDDKIVDSYLSGALGSRKPKLFSCLE